MLFLRRTRSLSTTGPIRFKSGSAELEEVLGEKIASSRKKVLAFRKKHGKTVIDKVTVNQVIGGMRNVKVLISTISTVDPQRGILWRGKTITECVELLPKVPGTNVVYSEGLLWFLLTGDIPTEDQSERLSEDLMERKNFPKYVKDALTNLDRFVPPMVQLSVGVSLMSTDSKYREAYDEGFSKMDLWKPALHDTLDLMANLPELTATIYAYTYKNGKMNPKSDTPDWAGNFADAMGFSSEEGRNLMRLHMFLHCDHDVGPVSSHAVHLVGSAHADPFLSFAAGLNGLAGPIHGNAARTSVTFVKSLRDKYGDSPTDEEIADHIKGMMKKRQVIPGFGHAVLRITDPRYCEIRTFCLANFPDDPLVRIVEKLNYVVPPLIKHKAANPYPNIDAYSGVAWQYMGLKELSFNTVLFGVSRALGSLAQYVWARALLLPIERPTCVNLKYMMENMDEFRIE